MYCQVFWLALATFSPSAPPSREAEAPADSAQVCPSVLRVGLHVDRVGLEDWGDVLVERSRERGLAVLRQWDVRPPGAGDPAFHLVLSQLEGDSGFAVDYQVKIDGEAVASLSGRAECRLCTDAEFYDEVEARVDGLMNRWTAMSRPLPMCSKATDTAVASSNLTEGPSQGLQIAGISLLSVGMAGVGVGTGFLASVPLLPENSRPQSRLTIPGAAVAAGSAVLVGAGIALLVVHRRRTRTTR